MSKTLVCTQNFLPYMKGDVFTVTDEEWAATQSETPEKGRDIKTNPLVRSCVEEYKPNKEEHVALLEAQRGKSVDADNKPNDSSTGATTYKAQADARVAEAEKARDEALAKQAEAEKALAEVRRVKEAEPTANDSKKHSKKH